MVDRMVQADVREMPAVEGSGYRRSGVRTIALTDSVQFIRGVGPYRARQFAKLGIDTVGDLIEHYPFRFDIKPKSVPIGQLREAEVCTIVGEIRRPMLARNGLFRATVVDATGSCAVRWFNSPFLKDRLRAGVVVRVSGKVSVRNGKAALANPATEIFAEGEDALDDDETRRRPVYPASAELDSRVIARAIETVLEPALTGMSEFLPEALRVRHGLGELTASVRAIHQSDDDIPHEEARRRLAYDEFLLSQLSLRLARRRQESSAASVPLRWNEHIDARIRARLPFALAEGQNAAVGEIIADLKRKVPMNRLLQGDVGAGKTAVAIYAALMAIASRGQVAMLAPTEVLARQHHLKFQSYLKDSQVNSALLVGGAGVRQKRSILEGCRSGETDLLLGTHAILEQKVAFRKLVLVIVDEQHKFGVRQRALLRGKGTAPHLLVMTATPIPRTLAMTVFGDLDVSVIRGVVPGRQPIETQLVSKSGAQGAWQSVRAGLARGEQAYVIYPLVEESEQFDWKAATVEVDRLREGELSGFRVGLLHGRMRSIEKQQVMDEFAAGEIDALVSTTVVEVGVDVGNATIMVVQHAQRYGLSQLHQLRGRIGRGTLPSQCFLFYDGDDGTASRRLKVLAKTQDGFQIAEEDLRIRGPGELLGTRQHGLPRFKAGDVVNDAELLQSARDDAAAILREDPALSLPIHRGLEQAVQRRYGRKLALVNVG